MAWQRHPTHATEYLTEQAGQAGRSEGGRLDDVGLDVTHRRTPIGRWVARQRPAWDTLNKPQRERLLALGPTPSAIRRHPGRRRRSRGGGARAGQPRPTRTREQTWAIVVGTAAAHRARVGHLEVPRAHVESVTAFDGWPEDVRSGVWVTTTRSRRAKLSAERIAKMNALGMRRT